MEISWAFYRPLTPASGIRACILDSYLTATKEIGKKKASDKISKNTLPI